MNLYREIQCLNQLPYRSTVRTLNPFRNQFYITRIYPYSTHNSPILKNRN